MPKKPVRFRTTADYEKPSGVSILNHLPILYVDEMQEFPQARVKSFRCSTERHTFTHKIPAYTGAFRMMGADTKTPLIEWLTMPHGNNATGEET